MRAAVFLGILAVIAGIFGMHVMTGSHASHAAAGQGAPAHAAPAHSGTAHSGDVTRPAGDAAVVLSAGAVCSETCPGAGEPGASCVPSPNAGALTALAPPSPAIRLARSAAAVTGAAYSYIPSSPTPCELSISRT